jgi:hypothetical protein
MSFFIYHDKVAPRARLHRDSCGACKGGRGMHGHQVTTQNEWYGPFGTKQQAMQRAQALGIGGLTKDCGLCKP